MNYNFPIAGIERREQIVDKVLSDDFGHTLLIQLR